MGKEDTGWAWVCLAASFLTMFIIGALNYSIGTLQLALLEVYHEEVAKTSVILVASAGSMFCTAPLAAFVVNATNCKICCVIGGVLLFTGLVSSAFIHNLDALVVTYGLISGFGKSLGDIAVSLSVGYNFNRRRSVAAGIFATGAGLGIFAGSPILRSLLDSYGLDGTFLILSAICLHMSLFGMLLRPTKFESGSRINSEKERHRRKSVGDTQIQQFKGQMLNILKNPSFLAFMGSEFSWSFGGAAIIVHIQSFSYSTGVRKEDAALLMTLVGVGSIFSRLLVGFSTSASGLDGMVVYLGQCAIIGVATTLFPLYSITYVGQVVYYLLHGLYTGGLYAQLIPLTAEVVGVHLLSPAIGIINFAMGVGWMLGPYLAGFILDSGGTYQHCFILSGGSFLLASILVMLTVLLKRDVHVSEDGVRDTAIETVPLSHRDLSDD